MPGYPPILKVRITDSDLDPVSIAAGKMESRFIAAFEAAIASIKSNISMRELSEAILTGDTMAVERILRLSEAFAEAFKGVGLPAEVESLREAVTATFAAGAKAAMSKLPKGLQADITFDLVNPRAVQFLRDYEFDLIRDISVGTRESIRDVMIRAFEEGMHPRVAAREIRQHIGLTEHQTAAVRRFQQALIDGDAATAMRFKLRDRRFDATLRAHISEGGLIADRTPFTPEQIQRMTDRYFERFLKHRSEAIARTETIRASNAGQHELWQQSIDDGLIDPRIVQRRWITARDERVCPICGPLHGTIVAFGEEFTSLQSVAEHPPIHVMCRCGLVLHFPRSRAAPRPVGRNF